MKLKKQNSYIVSFSKLFSLILIATLAVVLGNNRANAAALTAGTVTQSDSRPSTSSTYTMDFSTVTTSATRCIKMVFATTTTGTTVPNNMTTTGAAFSGTSDYIPTPASWTTTATVNGTVTLTYATGETPASASNRTVVLTGITNGDTVNTPYYLQFSTFGNTDCATTPLDTATLAFVFVNGQVVTVTVDPSLTFSLALVASSQAVNGATTTIASTTSTVPFGRVTSSANAIAAHDLTVSTNSGTGYTIYTRYTGTLASGTPTIDDFSGSNGTPATFTAAGTEGFGYTTNDTSLSGGTPDRFTSSGGNKWAAFTTSNAEVAYSATAASSQTTRVGYQVGISNTTEALTYTTTVIYTVVPLY